MSKMNSRPLVRRLGTCLLAIVITISLLSVVATNVLAGAVNVYDFAGVLNKPQRLEDALEKLQRLYRA